MIKQLCDINDNLITDKITKFLPRQDTIKIVNKLLDGSYHIQTIGNAAKLMDIICHVDASNKVVIDAADATSSPLIVKWDGKFYKGVILNTPTWEEFVRGDSTERVYTGQFTITIDEEGVDA